MFDVTCPSQTQRVCVCVWKNLSIILECVCVFLYIPNTIREIHKCVLLNKLIHNKIRTTLPITLLCVAYICVSSGRTYLYHGRARPAIFDET